MGNARNDPLARTLIITAAQIGGTYLGGPWGGFGATVAATALLGEPDSKQSIGPNLGPNLSQLVNTNQQFNSNATVGGVIPKIYGVARYFPKIITPAHRVADDQSKITVIYDLGLGDAQVQKVSIGEQNITEFSDVVVRLVNPNQQNYSSIAGWQVYPIHQNFESAELVIDQQISSQNYPGYFEATIVLTKNTYPAGGNQKVNMYFTFPRGLRAGADVGGLQAAQAVIRIRYRKVGATTWLPLMHDLIGGTTATNVGRHIARPYADDINSPTVEEQERAKYWLDTYNNIIPSDQWTPAGHGEGALNVMYLAWGFGADSSYDGSNYGVAAIKRQVAASGLKKLPSDFDVRSHRSYSVRPERHTSNIDEWWGIPKGDFNIDVADGLLWNGGIQGYGEIFNDVDNSGNYLRGYTSNSPANTILKGAFVYLDYFGWSPAPDGVTTPTNRVNQPDLPFDWFGGKLLVMPKPIGIVKNVIEDWSGTGQSATRNSWKTRIVCQNLMQTHEPVVGVPRDFISGATAQKVVDNPEGLTYEEIMWASKRNNWYGLSGVNTTFDVAFARDHGVWATSIALAFINPHPSDVAVTGSTYSPGGPKSDCNIPLTFPNKVSGQSADYEVNVSRNFRFSAGTQNDANNIDDMRINTFKHTFDEAPVIRIGNRSQLFMQLTYPATQIFTGTGDNQLPNDVNAEVLSLQPVLGPGTGTTLLPHNQSTNPADIVLDILTNSSVNKNAIPLSLINMDSFREYYNFCHAVPTSPPGQTWTRKRFDVGFLLDYETTVQALLNKLLTATRAGLRYIDGKYEIFLDRAKDPVQVFTPINSWGFQSSVEHREDLTGVNVSFLDNWKVNNIRVHESDPGVSLADDTRVNEIDVEAFGCGNVNQAWRHGRYLLYQNRYRNETYRLNCDYEHLVCNVGDRVQIAYEQIRGGGVPQKITAISGSNITIHPGVDFDASKGYQAIVRSYKEEAGTLPFVYQADITNTDDYTIQVTVPDGEPNPRVGDLLIIGLRGNVSLDCMIKSIRPNEDLSAELELVQYNEKIFASEQTTSDVELDDTGDPLPPGPDTPTPDPLDPDDFDPEPDTPGTEPTPENPTPEVPEGPSGDLRNYDYDIVLTITLGDLACTVPDDNNETWPILPFTLTWTEQSGSPLGYEVYMRKRREDFVGRRLSWGSVVEGEGDTQFYGGWLSDRFEHLRDGFYGTLLATIQPGEARTYSGIAYHSSEYQRPRNLRASVFNWFYRIPYFYFVNPINFTYRGNDYLVTSPSTGIDLSTYFYIIPITNSHGRYNITNPRNLPSAAEQRRANISPLTRRTFVSSPGQKKLEFSPTTPRNTATTFTGVVEGENLVLSWNADLDCFNRGAQIKFSTTASNFDDASFIEQGTVLNFGGRHRSVRSSTTTGSQPTNTITIPYQSGYYYLKCLDIFGNLQRNALTFNSTSLTPEVPDTVVGGYETVYTWRNQLDWSGAKYNFTYRPTYVVRDGAKTTTYHNVLQLEPNRRGVYRPSGTTWRPDGNGSSHGRLSTTGQAYKNVQLVSTFRVTAPRAELTMREWGFMNELSPMNEDGPGGGSGWGMLVETSDSQITTQPLSLGNFDRNALSATRTITGSFSHIHPYLAAWTNHTSNPPFFQAYWQVEMKMRKTSQTKIVYNNTSRTVNVTFDNAFYKNILATDVTVEGTTNFSVTNQTQKSLTITFTTQADVLSTVRVTANGFGEF